MIIYEQTNKTKLAVKQLAKRLVLFNKNGQLVSVYAISSSDFWNYLQI